MYVEHIQRAAGNRTIDWDVLDTAIEFACRAHATQLRKKGDIPYIAHPVSVAIRLYQEAGQHGGCGPVGRWWTWR